ncbi:site-2 protease family protein [Novosphingobium sp.]|uniref:site-2 protease family protein n=1 Tax=Novosphingobium sp. TaxID=1874826 RepID=UPI00286B601C|nr:site-2 protease family protein [Novosphingobium sp.]
MNETVFQIAALVIPLVIAIVFHEVSHGFVARSLGDPTAQLLGRLSLNPFKHVDPFGTVILPAILKLSGLPVFGWAKPVPVRKELLRNPRRDMMLVAAAGPGSNLVMAVIGAVLLGLLLRFTGGGAATGLALGFVALNLLNFILINVFLALFNLLPVPPFDGGHIIEGLLPAGLAARYGELHKYALLVMILLIVVLPMISPSLNVIGWVVSPAVDWLTGHYLELARAVAGL